MYIRYNRYLYISLLYLFVISSFQFLISFFDPIALNAIIEFFAACTSLLSGNNLYISENSCRSIDIKGWWIDAGTPERIKELESKLI